MRGHPTQVQLTLYQHYKTGRARLLSVGIDKEKAQWVPCSQLTVHATVNGQVTITMPEWLAVKKGFVPRARVTFGGNHA